jgi:NADH-quinone oxidoreductase subunit J
MSTLAAVYFYFCAALAVGGAASVVLSKNPIRGAMGLLLLIVSVAGLFLALHAQFLAAIQLIVYAGAIVVLFLFVIMLLGPNAATPDDRRGLYLRAFSGALFGLAGAGAIFAVAHAVRLGLPMHDVDSSFGGIDAFGGALFSDGIAPFELSSALLMVAVIGAIAVARGRQGVKTLSRAEEAIARSAPVADLGIGHSGVFSHEIHADADPKGGAR